MALDDCIVVRDTLCGCVVCKVAFGAIAVVSAALSEVGVGDIADIVELVEVD